MSESIADKLFNEEIGIIEREVIALRNNSGPAILPPGKWVTLDEFDIRETEKKVKI